MIHIGIDPGQSGGLAMIDDCAKAIKTEKFKDATPADISEMFEFILEFKTEGIDIFAMIENVHSMPKQGVASSFTFGKSFGFLIGMLTAHKIPFDFVTPQKWQKELGCMSKGDKNVTKQKAQQFWPECKITHANADALLIAEYCRRAKS